MKKAQILLIIIICFNLSAIANNITIDEDKVIKIVLSNPKVLEYSELFVNKRDSGVVMYFERSPKKDKLDYFDIYVGEKFFKEKRYVRFTTFYYYYKTRELYEYDVINDKEVLSAYNKLLFATIKVDSSFSGYNPQPLTDGVINTESLPPTKAAWASAETNKEHWIKATFDKKEKIKQIVIYWASDKGQFFKSKKIKIFLIGNTGREIELTDIKVNNNKIDRTVIFFKEKTSNQITIKQSPEGGSTSRPNLIWIREVCVY